MSGLVSERKGMLLRLDPAVHDALAKWAADELRSTNAQIEFLLRRALAEAGRLPGRGPDAAAGRPPAASGPSRPATRRRRAGGLAVRPGGPHRRAMPRAGQAAGPPLVAFRPREHPRDRTR